MSMRSRSTALCILLRVILHARNSPDVERKSRNGIDETVKRC
jgi:hypothetical protein